MNEKTVILGCWPPCGREQSHKIRTISTQKELLEAYGQPTQVYIPEPIYICIRRNDREAVAVCKVIGDIILTREEVGLDHERVERGDNNIIQFHTSFLNEAQFKTFRGTKALPEWYYRGMYVYMADTAHGHMATVLVMEKEKPEMVEINVQWEEPDED